MDVGVWVDGKEVIQQHDLDAGKYAGRQVYTKVVEVRVLPSRGTNHVKVQGDEAIVMRCGRKAERIMALSGWLARQAQGGVYKQSMHGAYKFNKNWQGWLVAYQRWMLGWLGPWVRRYRVHGWQRRGGRNL